MSIRCRNPHVEGVLDVDHEISFSHSRAAELGRIHRIPISDLAQTPVSVLEALDALTPQRRTSSPAVEETALL